MKLSDGTVLSSAFRASDDLTSQHGFQHIKKSNNLLIGTIIAVRNIDSTEGIQKSADNTKDGSDGSPYETVYDVKVDANNARPFIFNGCRASKPFMGANNYFDMIHESADLSTTYVEAGIAGIFTTAAESMVGSRCVILCIEGAPTAPVILGFLQHPARKSKITKDKKLHMEMQFQGLNVSIDKDGAFKLEANGPYVPPITTPIGPVPESSIRANTLVGPFSIEITKDMRFILKDNKDQMIKVDREAGEMTITNGAELIKFKKSLSGDGEMTINCSGKQTLTSKTGEYTFSDSLKITAKELKITADSSTQLETGAIKFAASQGFELKAQEVKVNAQTSFALETKTMAFKGATGELLAILKEMAEAFGTLTAASPVGPCAPLQGAPQWAQVMAAIQKLAGLMG